MSELLLTKAWYIRLQVAANELAELALEIPELAPHFSAVEAVARKAKVAIGTVSK